MTRSPQSPAMLEHCVEHYPLQIPSQPSPALLWAPHGWPIVGCMNRSLCPLLRISGTVGELLDYPQGIQRSFRREVRLWSSLLFPCETTLAGVGGSPFLDSGAWSLRPRIGMASSVPKLTGLPHPTPCTPLRLLSQFLTQLWVTLH